jgi:hypothetical protein
MYACVFVPRRPFNWKVFDKRTKHWSYQNVHYEIHGRWITWPIAHALQQLILLFQQMESLVARFICRLCQSTKRSWRPVHHFLFSFSRQTSTVPLEDRRISNFLFFFGQRRISIKLIIIYFYMSLKKSRGITDVWNKECLLGWGHERHIKNWWSF